MSLVKVEVKEGSYILPPQVLDINLVKIMSSINKPLNSLTIRDICAWHEKTENHIEYSIELPDKYTKTVEYNGDGKMSVIYKTDFEGREYRQVLNVPIIKPPVKNVHNPLNIQIGDKISSDIVKEGAILRCIGLSDDERFLDWEDFIGITGHDTTSLFKKYVHGIDTFVMEPIPSAARIPNSARSMGYLITDVGYVLVNVVENIFKRGDYISPSVYVKDIYQYTNHYGLVLDIDTKDFIDMGYKNHKVNGNVFLTNIQNVLFETGLLIKPNIIVESIFKNDFGPESICKLRIYEGSFVVNKSITKFGDKNFYNENHQSI
ncbi:MAG: hypothetical protein WAT79_08655 [Saprospiraceae bacterium]